VETVAQQQGIRITGNVVDNYGDELIGVAVQLRSDMAVGVATDIDGNFSITVPGMNEVLVFTFIGMETQELRLVAGTTNYNVVMNPDAALLEAVVVEAGFFQRDRATMTGAATQFSQEELRNVGTINVLQAIRTLEPAFVMIENIHAGSDPNRMPTFELRGQSGIEILGIGEEATGHVNMPLFLIDSFEATLQEVNDLDISRIASITLLKDAGSTAIFGARGANGVVVIETVRPAAGRVEVRYSGNFDFSWADLSGYNMMNAREKLEFERRSGFFGNLENPSNEMGIDRYNNARRRVEAGVDVDWLRVPVRLGFTQNHSLNVSGGDDVWLFSAGINYRNIQGVMRGSTRETYGGNIRVVYRGVEGLTIQNNLTISGVSARRGGWGNFSNFAHANPYMTPYNEYGQLIQFLDAGTWNRVDGERAGTVANPLWNASLFTFDDERVFGMTNNTGIIWRILPNLRVEGNLSLNHSTTNSTVFHDARDTRFARVEIMRSGTFFERNAHSFSYTADTRASYTKVINDDHVFTFSGRAHIRDNTAEHSSFLATGFPRGAEPLPSFAYSFAENSRPVFSHIQRRTAGISTHINYNFQQRYMIDLTVNREGSNAFGTHHLFTTIWSVGAGWNVHREEFMQNQDWLSELRFRINYGTTANQQDRPVISNIYNFFPGSNLFGMSSYSLWLSL
jgi:TonB-linked SusC/RagA family outer membrane protein